ncbi:MAG: hypothetical protein FP815_00510, partial [Desulfobulbaceae bacterium]|nr:hypothetical protein [Desulfobulbaceae bacterium]
MNTRIFSRTARHNLATILFTLTSWFLATSASAALLSLPHAPTSPSLTFGPTSSVIYTFGNSVFVESASPIAIQKDSSDLPHFINPTGSSSSETFMISINVDNTGKLIGGDGGDDLLIIGEVDLDGNGSIDAAGTLLTGEIIQFGFQNVTSTDRFDFRFRVTGGKLADLGIYKPGIDDLYVYTTSETSTFTGSFATDFSGQAKGYVWATPTTAIGDLIWHDENGNGIQDDGEAGMPDVPVKLQDCNSNTITTTTTNSNGHYLFSGLLPGNYQTLIIAPAEYTISPLDQGGDDYKDSDTDPTTSLSPCTPLASGEQNLTVDAGLYLPASIGDFVWNDLNHDGVQDIGENGLDNWTVNITGPNGFTGTTQTSNG